MESVRAGAGSDATERFPLSPARPPPPHSPGDLLEARRGAWLQQIGPGHLSKIEAKRVFLNGRPLREPYAAFRGPAVLQPEDPPPGTRPQDSQGKLGEPSVPEEYRRKV